MALRLRHTLAAVARPGDESGYVGECPDLGVVTQALTLDELFANLKDAVELALDGEDLDRLGLIARPIVILSMELVPENA